MYGDVYADDYTYSDDNTDRDGDSNSYTYSDSYRDTNADSDLYSDTNTNAGASIIFHR